MTEHCVRHYAKGAFYGLIIGDALGAPFEFKDRDSFRCDGRYSSGGIWQARPGEWTDDSSMALALADSLSRYPEGNPTDQLERYLNWYQWGDYCTREACFDIGNTTRKALERFRAYRHPASGSIDPNTSGNGALMRLAPAVIAGLHQDQDIFERLLTESSKTTHASPESVACSLIMGHMMRQLIDGDTPDQAFAYCQATLQERLSPVSERIALILQGNYRTLEREQLGVGGYVAEALENALWSLHHSDDFLQAVTLAVNLGGDTDTLGAITGQLAGACYGFNQIPATLIYGLKEAEMIAGIWQQLDQALPLHRIRASCRRSSDHNAQAVLG